MAERTTLFVSLPFRAAWCPDCGRTFSAETQYCPVDERPTRLYSPVRDYLNSLGTRPR